ncbi:hypothetical protein HMPREF3191_00651 [Veillonellaceae bacterium DNF00626]|nr:hypothetical protein HMPREF3191_00651 [Veillonellaceae bacterium DNF00626]
MYDVFICPSSDVFTILPSCHSIKTYLSKTNIYLLYHQIPLSPIEIKKITAFLTIFIHLAYYCLKMKYFDTKFPIHFLQKPQMRITSISPVRKKISEQKK